jgi:hypothetical protein
MSASPATKKMKKHISSMLQSQAKSAKNNANKDELSLLQAKLTVARENAATHAFGSQEREKAEILLKKLQKKLNDALESSIESDSNVDDAVDSKDGSSSGDE